MSIVVYIYAIHANANEWHSNVTFLDTVLYHGEAYLDPDRGGIASHLQSDQSCSPMKLAVNGWSLGPVLLPERSATLVVSDSIHKLICKALPEVELRKVKFDKVINVPWRKGSSAELLQLSSYSIRVGNEMSIFAYAPHDELAASSLESYYELMPVNYYDIRDRYSDMQPFFTEHYEGQDHDDGDYDCITVNAKMFIDNPIVTVGFPVVSEMIYNILKPFIDEDMFGIKSIKL